MHASYHVQLTTHALGSRLSPRALKAVIAGNLGQDGLRGQFGHPEFHFDDSQFVKGQAYVEAQREIVLLTLKNLLDASSEGSPQGQAHACRPAWSAFGRLTHAVQDFYAHSNYAALWLESKSAGQGAVLNPNEIEPLEPSLLNSLRLHSGRTYYPLDALAFIPALAPLVKPFLPRDSHTWMNLDHPGQGPLFPFALSAALKRTIAEYERTVEIIRDTAGQAALALFSD